MADIDIPAFLTPTTPPLVFVGPSIPAEEVRRLLPNAELRPPVRRGDLHLARMLRYSVMVILDGVFSQNDAVSPREVADVLRDGAIVVGAASMGALRAVDCAPLGAIGAGRIFRMFRRGLIDSEDEVAVTFNPERPYPSLTVPLAGVRIALRRAERKALISRTDSETLLRTAQSLHYSERTWRNIFSKSLGAAPSAELSGWLRKQDPKREDARRALIQVARLQERDPRWAVRPRTTRAPFVDLDDLRVSPPGSALGRDINDDDAGFVLWLLVTGRANRWLGEARSALETLHDFAPILPENWYKTFEQLNWRSVKCKHIDRTTTFSGYLIDRMSSSGEIEAERFRFRAASEFMRTAGSNALSEVEHRLLQSQIAAAHGMEDWNCLMACASSEVSDLISDLARQWARARTAVERKYTTNGTDDESNGD